MRRLVDQHVTRIKNKCTVIETVLPLEDLIRGSKKRRNGCIPRPPNAFIIYRKEIQARLGNTGVSTKERITSASGVASKQWKVEDPTVKAFFQALSDAASAIYNKLSCKNKGRKKCLHKVTTHVQHTTDEEVIVTTGNNNINSNAAGDVSDNHEGVVITMDDMTMDYMTLMNDYNYNYTINTTLMNNNNYDNINTVNNYEYTNMNNNNYEYTNMNNYANMINTTYTAVNNYANMDTTLMNSYAYLNMTDTTATTNNDIYTTMGDTIIFNNYNNYNYGLSETWFSGI